VFAVSQSGLEPSAPRIIALTGFMGAGKTSIGSALAALLGWSFADLDQEIERQQNKPIREIFRMRGEPEFREIETSTLQRMLEQVSGPTVIALGGGTFVQLENVDLLRNSSTSVVFLETPLDEMLERCAVGGESPEESVRPLASAPDAFRELYAQRLPQYRTADLTVSTAGKTAEDNAREIALRLELVEAAH
jgi:shikimate kinase